MLAGGMYGRPKRAARRTAALLEPPSISTGCGCVHGRGVTCTVVPRYANGSPLPALRLASRDRRAARGVGHGAVRLALGPPGCRPGLAVRAAPAGEVPRAAGAARPAAA